MTQGRSLRKTASLIPGMAGYGDGRAKTGDCLVRKFHAMLGVWLRLRHEIRCTGEAVGDLLVPPKPWQAKPVAVLEGFCSSGFPAGGTEGNTACARWGQNDTCRKAEVGGAESE